MYSSPFEYLGLKGSTNSGHTWLVLSRCGIHILSKWKKNPANIVLNKKSVFIRRFMINEKCPTIKVAGFVNHVLDKNKESISGTSKKVSAL